ncbi:EAL domain-containing protein [Pseudanabaena yagii]|uniref:EAL domain-containing protein n=1 Tax=Pseudanabaena yagii GIHE-NHR1 TaxID=2722753 RepID=A0ABX1LU99_9CYAN|nr:EAL domain-containing protein [Pseudanabaena yagii]NMF58858.1 EAL domain-containing protein [Pseudanabaena yagii GIHE-NHR1]
MKDDQEYKSIGCWECTKGAGLGFDFTMAFQPIVDTTSKKVFAQEALVRGTNEEPAGEILGCINDENRYRFDQACRVKAVQLGAALNIDSFISINFLPNAVYRPELCIRTTIEAAETFGFPVKQIIFEFTEGEKITDHVHLREIIQYYRDTGFLTAIDDFGAGYSGLNLLADFQTDLVKLDMGLIRDISHNKNRQAIVKGIVQVCNELAIKVIAEGVETYEELTILQSFGIELFQGYYFAKPKFKGLAVIHNL